MVNEIHERNLILADELLQRSGREILALSLNDDGRWRENYRTAMIIKNQKINERLVWATWAVAIGTIILSTMSIGLTLYFQYFK